MEEFEYKVVGFERNNWTGRAKGDYVEILNEYGALGWRFKEFVPAGAKPKGALAVEMLFERVIKRSISQR